MGLGVSTEERGRVLDLAGGCNTCLYGLLQGTHGLRAYDGLSLPEDAETVSAGRAGWNYSDPSDDEDLLADEAEASGGNPQTEGSPVGFGCRRGCQDPRILPKVSSMKWAQVPGK